VRTLALRGCRFVTPLGVGAVLERCGVDGTAITECDWWERVDIVPGALTLVATPTRHFSGRGLRDRNSTLWASWAVLGRTHRAFFGADGGFDPLYGAIGEVLGPFDLTMLEIGAFDPAWAHIHLGPENALRAHRLLRGAALLPIHWGTFSLAPHAWFDPPERVLAAATEEECRVFIPRIGGTVDVAAPADPHPWWREFAGR
jgi:L-ascorbate metabolism protein UlaG (beta-lactamase superfamily)